MCAPPPPPLPRTTPENALRGEQREGVAQVEAHGGAKLGVGAGAGAVAAVHAVPHHFLNHLQILRRREAKHKGAHLSTSTISDTAPRSAAEGTGGRVPADTQSSQQQQQQRQQRRRRQWRHWQSAGAGTHTSTNPPGTPREGPPPLAAARGGPPARPHPRGCSTKKSSAGRRGRRGAARWLTTGGSGTRRRGA